MANEIVEEKGLVVRHGTVELIEHWAIAISGLLLVATGFFQMPTANRYYFTSVPGLSWSGDFIVSLNVHYAASVVFIAAGIFHLIYHGMRGDRGLVPQKGDIRTSIAVIKTFFGKGEEPPFHKYLPEQRLAYAGMAFIIAMLILSGLVKTYKNIYAPDMSLTVVLVATWVHNIFFVFFVLAFFGHIAAIILKPNRPMVRGIFTGTVRLDYAKHRHPLWISDIEVKEETAVPEEQDALSAETSVAEGMEDAPPGEAPGEVAGEKSEEKMAEETGEPVKKEI